MDTWKKQYSQVGARNRKAITIAEIVTNHTGPFWQKHGPVSISSLTKLQERYPLPDNYLELLCICNGCAGQMSISPGRFELWTSEEVLERNERLKLTEDCPGFLAIGGDGGGEMFMLDLQSTAIYMAPFMSIGMEDAIKIAKNLEAFMMRVGHECVTKDIGIV